jgi:hypothetical protein
LLITLFFLPLPLLSPAYVGLKESQFGHTNRKLLSILFFQFPSTWSATKGTFPVLGFT